MDGRWEDVGSRGPGPSRALRRTSETRTGSDPSGPEGSDPCPYCPLKSLKSHGAKRNGPSLAPSPSVGQGTLTMEAGTDTLTAPRKSPAS